MENQGYEEEQSRIEEQSVPKSCHRDQQLYVDTIDGDPSVARATTYPESHLYEDISINTEISTQFLEQTSSLSETQDNNETDNHEIQDQQPIDFTKQAWVNGTSSNTSLVIEKSNQQNSTLSSLVEISANYNRVSSSPRAVSRTSEDDTEGFNKNPCSFHRNVKENISSIPRQSENFSRDTIVQSDRRPNRRRKKKDCKHCRNKLSSANTCEKLDELVNNKDTILKETGNDHREKNPDVSNFLFRDSILKSQNIKIYPMLNKTSFQDLGTKKSYSTAFHTSENGSRLMEDASNFLANAQNDKMLHKMTESKQNKLLEAPRNSALSDMRINSIYSQDRWYDKDTSIFYTDFKDQNPFQKAYSLPVRTHTPTSQNRVNLRRSVRNDPPPHPARLDKHRRGWTLHLARPLKASKCSCSLVPLLIIVLVLLGVAGITLYIVFEPEKLQIIQQYLKSSTDKLMGQNITSSESFTAAISNDEPNFTDMTKTSSPSTDMEIEDMSHNTNVTRYCDDCFEGEVCVALVDEEVPTCKSPQDLEDPTGCAGLCAINQQKCHRLDLDAFRCVKVEHYCLENEWTCSNTLCIPMEKHCDGHMNCYDHSDEYDCVCNLKTHFQCGNETSCLPLERRCDGKIDCWDATDEINCTLGRNLSWSCPLESEFTCNNGECILKVRFCDGLADCSDRSDEPHGCQGKCNKHEFTCQNGRCITKGMRCNGVDDCGDGTDERHCKDIFT
ncbi:uncharacterized protein LOC105181089 isoform X3 [Harpegnathos saltator]|uniref:uncharacterized protein LOC105181089 isoform X3 n=1 Tax=Harpegnathos saltator TaxID=610380 RepID=UPI000DBEEA85|nr:uncharacterized protein LOC105181089 isoform X3 [Harpegnathos saltator]